MHWLPVLILRLAALGFLGFGLWLLVAPLSALGPLGIEVTGAAAVTELRAFYGGLELGLAAWLLAASFRPAWVAAALWAVFAINLGIGLARLVGVLVDGAFVPFFAGALAWEFGFAILALVALRKKTA